MADKTILDITGKLFVDYKAREWCKLPYPDHPQGCPNFNVRENCPPKVQLIENYMDFSKPHYFAIVTFNLQNHIQNMLALHPKWSDRQSRCCLYWQNGVRNQLEDLCRLFKFEHPEVQYTLCPEAMGVNVIRTLKSNGIHVEVKPKISVRKVALISYAKGIK